MRKLVLLFWLIIASAAGRPNNPFPLVTFSDFLNQEHKRHILFFRRICSLEAKLCQMLIDGAEGGAVLIPLDIAWTNNNIYLLDDNEWRRCLLHSLFVRREISRPDGLIRLRALNHRYIYHPPEEADISGGHICSIDESKCAKVITLRVFSDILGVFIDKLLLSKNYNQDETSVEDRSRISNQISLTRNLKGGFKPSRSSSCTPQNCNYR